MIDQGYLFACFVVIGVLVWHILREKQPFGDNTHKAKVLKHIRQHGSISSAEAKSLGIRCLSAVICKLKKHHGFDIININPHPEKAEYRFR